jgi:hypothetical protein
VTQLTKQFHQSSYESCKHIGLTAHHNHWWRSQFKVIFQKVAKMFVTCSMMTLMISKPSLTLTSVFSHHLWLTSARQISVTYHRHDFDVQNMHSRLHPRRTDFCHNTFSYFICWVCLIDDAHRSNFVFVLTQLVSVAQFIFSKVFTSAFLANAFWPLLGEQMAQPPLCYIMAFLVVRSTRLLSWSA